MPASNRINRKVDSFNHGETPLPAGTAGQILDRQLKVCAIIPDRSQGHRIRSNSASPARAFPASWNVLAARHSFLQLRRLAFDESRPRFASTIFDSSPSMRWARPDGPWTWYNRRCHGTDGLETLVILGADDHDPPAVVSSGFQSDLDQAAGIERGSPELDPQP
jgi:hypothetical protein